MHIRNLETKKKDYLWLCNLTKFTSSSVKFSFNLFHIIKLFTNATIQLIETKYNKFKLNSKHIQILLN